MNTLIEQINGILPAKYVTYATLIWLLIQASGRAYHSIVSGGGLVNIWRALIFGTNTPKPEKPENKS